MNHSRRWHRCLPLWQTCALLVLELSASPQVVNAQTPSPLQEWQYSPGIDLVKMFNPPVSDWQKNVGVAVDYRPLYEGAKTYRVLGGPVVDIRYKDVAFFSVGEGIGVNLVRGNNYRSGVAIGYDLGRRDEQDLTHLSGMGDIGRAPAFKLFGDYVVSAEFPLVLRIDARKIIGGARGWVGDVEAYTPMPGSSEKFVWFAGPSVKVADRLHMQTTFGVSGYQATASGYSAYSAHGGLNAAGFGFSGNLFLGGRWVVSLDGAVNRLLGSSLYSPITQSKAQAVCDIAAAYRW